MSLLARWRDLTPDAVAVSGPGGDLTYAELHRRVSALAGVLRGRGVRPEVPVGLCLERTTGMLVAMLAVWAAGGAYVPLDPAFPEDRLRLMRQDAGIRLVLTQPGVDERLVAGVPEVLTISEGGLAAKDAEPGLWPHGDLAYLMYTSGSTGRPKGVAVPHRAVTHLIESFADTLKPAPGDVWLAVTTLSFDISVLELLLPLACGARVVIAADTADGKALRELAIAQGVTIMQATPAGWRVLLESGGVPEQIATRLCGGEALPRDLADALLADGVRLWNVYGPTETTVWSAAGLVAPAPAPVTLGDPVGDTGLYVLAEDGSPAEEGELHIGGAGVARGYRGLPRMTAARFLPDPFSPRRGTRMYATGDLVRRTAAGLEYLGRADQQVKVRGFRIELGEIETALRSGVEIRQAAAAVHPGPDGTLRLVAYVVPQEADPGALWPVLRERLRRTLPEYMVPAHLVVLEALPLTPNGKLDRAALPPPAWTRVGTVPYREPATPVEQELAAIWGEVLGVAEPIGADDDFFDLGGHSLAATQIIAKIQARFAIVVPIVLLFEHSTVAALAREMELFDPDELDLDEVASLRDQLDGLSAEDLAAIFDDLAAGS
ncbi:hypothetical protein Aple_015980 [Acrocarpospora pleiomorpha]|uniref:Carrier domain-containing protein n=1 Tax=Acrocarpospora pleiomorpha TaxID=90975 RepID=A0A5M3XI24_9ACTN|nr:non-ribosomal peptide synthetase [Acrocarpospora pleiomorpha]GES18703.1 hypothetical protein Aple_015980 [Acrocarpospora pleiomorpha]